MFFSFQHQGQRARASFESALRTTDSYTKHESVAQAERTRWTAVYLALATQANEVTFLHLKHFLCVEAFLVIHHNIPRIKVEVLHLSIYFYSCYATCTFVFCFTALRAANHPSVNVLNLCISLLWCVIWPSLWCGDLVSRKCMWAGYAGHFNKQINQSINPCTSLY